MIPLTSIRTSAFTERTSLPSYSTVPLIGPSWPRTVVTIMCRTLKLAAECEGSTVHWFGASCGLAAGGWGAGVWALTEGSATVVARSASRSRFIE